MIANNDRIGPVIGFGYFDKSYGTALRSENIISICKIGSAPLPLVGQRQIAQRIHGERHIRAWWNCLACWLRHDKGRRGGDLEKSGGACDRALGIADDYRVESTVGPNDVREGQNAAGGSGDIAR